jgi:hypothetical protein
MMAPTAIVVVAEASETAEATGLVTVRRGELVVDPSEQEELKVGIPRLNPRISDQPRIVATRPDLRH